MSGTSADGIDVALLETDGEDQIKSKGSTHIPYEPHITSALLREASKGYAKKDDGLHALEEHLTTLHSTAVMALLQETGLTKKDIAVVGMHGHSISHRPAQRLSWQLGNGRALAQSVDIDVVCDFRQEDLRHGGEGAPFAPLFHHALLTRQRTAPTDRHDDVAWRDPVAIVNIGGVANVTVLDKGKIVHAFDTGPGCALVDDWIRHCGVLAGMDKDGAYGHKGHVHDTIISSMIAHPYFARRPPKSLDRYDFGIDGVRHLSIEDGAATLTAFTAKALAKGQEWGNSPWRSLVITGGGRHNHALLQKIEEHMGTCAIRVAEDIGWHGDVLEAQAFAWLAVRHLRQLPLSLPCTTGVSHAMRGGVLHRASA